MKCIGVQIAFVVLAVLAFTGCKPPDISHVPVDQIAELRQDVELQVTFTCAKESGDMNQQFENDWKAQDYTVAVDVPFFYETQKDKVLSRKEDSIGTLQSGIQALTNGGRAELKVYVVKIGGKSERVRSCSYTTTAGSNAALKSREFDEVMKALRTKGRTIIEGYEENPDGIFTKVYLVRNGAIASAEVGGMEPVKRYPVVLNVYAVSYNAEDALKHVRNKLTAHEFELYVPERLWEQAPEYLRDGEAGPEFWNAKANWTSENGTVMRAEMIRQLPAAEDKFWVRIQLGNRPLIVQRRAVQG